MESKSCEQIFEQIMLKIGYNQRYQFIIMALFVAASFVTTAILIGTSFIFMNPIFQCTSKSGLQIVDEHIACSRIDQCKLVNDYTVVGYMKLYCDRQTLRSMIQSSLPIGSVLGLLIMNTLCDIKGRKWSVRVCFSFQLTGMIGTFLSILFNLPWCVAFFQIICAFGGYSLMMITYVIFYDVCSKQGVQNGIIFLNLMWGITEISFYAIDNWVRSWSTYMLFFLIIPTIILTLAVNLLFIDPPGFLLYKGHWSQALQSCLKMSIVNKNNTEASPKQFQNLINQYRVIRQRKSYNKHGFDHLMRKLFCRWKYLKRILLLTVIYGSGSLFYYGVQYAVNDIGLQYGINMLLLGLMQSGAFITLKFVAQRVFNFPRKKAITVFYAAAGIVGLITVIPAFGKSKIIITIAVALCRLFQTFAVYFFILLQTESFTPDIKATGVGFTQGFGQIGSFLAPYLINTLINLEIYPLGILSLIIVIVGIPPALLMDQTAKIAKEKGDQNLLNIQERLQASSVQIN